MPTLLPPLPPLPLLPLLRREPPVPTPTPTATFVGLEQSCRIGDRPGCYDACRGVLTFSVASPLAVRGLREHEEPEGERLVVR